MVAAAVNLQREVASNLDRTRAARGSSADLAKELRRLATERNAIILAHNYQVPELQDVADFVGDFGTLSLAREPGTDRQVRHVVVRRGKVAGDEGGDVRGPLETLNASLGLAEKAADLAGESWHRPG